MAYKEQLPDDHLSDLRIGCIGCGNMGSAILSGLIPLVQINPSISLSGYNRNPENLIPLKEKGIKPLKTLADAAQQNDILILGIKPDAVIPILKELLPFLRPGHIIISIAAGISQKVLSQTIENFCPIVRVMPNTPALIGKGIFAICIEDPKLSEQQQQQVIDLFSFLGLPIILPETQFSAFTALIGCGPAYIFYFIDALVEAGVTLGFLREQALNMVNELIQGSSSLLMIPGTHPVLLREQVCSPGGITISAMNHMDRKALKGTIVDTIFTAYAKSKELEQT